MYSLPSCISETLVLESSPRRNCFNALFLLQSKGLLTITYFLVIKMSYRRYRRVPLGNSQSSNNTTAASNTNYGLNTGSLLNYGSATATGPSYCTSSSIPSSSITTHHSAPPSTGDFSSSATYADSTSSPRHHRARHRYVPSCSCTLTTNTDSTGTTSTWPSTYPSTSSDNHSIPTCTTCHRRRGQRIDDNLHDCIRDLIPFTAAGAKGAPGLAQGGYYAGGGYRMGYRQEEHSKDDGRRQVRALRGWRRFPWLLAMCCCMVHEGGDERGGPTEVVTVPRWLSG